MKNIDNNELAALIQNLAEHSLDTDSKIIALVQLLEKKGVLTQHEFRQEHQSVLHYMKEEAKKIKRNSGRTARDA